MKPHLVTFVLLLLRHHGQHHLYNNEVTVGLEFYVLELESESMVIMVVSMSAQQEGGHDTGAIVESLFLKIQQ